MGVLAVIYCLVPLIYVVSVALTPRATLTGGLFKNFQFSTMFENFTALGAGKYSVFWSWILNSLIVSSVTAVGTVLMGAAAAYAFSRFRFRGRRGTLTGLLLIQMFPQMLAFVALYLLLLGIQDIFPVLGLNSKLGLICVYLGGALGSNTFLLYGFFNSIPRSLDEAAMIDGATHAQTFWTIIMPLVRPGSGGRWPAELHLSLGDFVDREGRPAGSESVHAGGRHVHVGSRRAYRPRGASSRLVPSSRPSRSSCCSSTCRSTSSPADRRRRQGVSAPALNP